MFGCFFVQILRIVMNSPVVQINLVGIFCCFSQFLCVTVYISSEMVQWSVVQFEAGGTVVVPRSWYNIEEKKCHWPPFKHHKLHKVIQDHHNPEPYWEIYESVRLLITKGDISFFF